MEGKSCKNNNPFAVQLDLIRYRMKGKCMVRKRKHKQTNEKHLQVPAAVRLLSPVRLLLGFVCFTAVDCSQPEMVISAHPLKTLHQLESLPCKANFSLEFYLNQRSHGFRPNHRLITLDPLDAVRGGVIFVLPMNFNQLIIKNKICKLHVSESCRRIKRNLIMI